jgi:oligopeptidase B
MQPDHLPHQTLPPAPVAPVHRHDFEVHGRRIEDPYAWLKAENWREVLKDPSALSPEIRAHLEAENAYTEAALAGTEALRECLVKEMRGRIKEDDSSVPQADGPWAYFTR